MKDLRTEIRREDRRFDSETADKTERHYAAIGKKDERKYARIGKEKERQADIRQDRRGFDALIRQARGIYVVLIERLGSMLRIFLEARRKIVLHARTLADAAEGKAANGRKRLLRRQFP